MKIAILGTRGIPNNYGGFEQLAENLSLGLVKNGHEVYVYSSSNHANQQELWNGIHIIHAFDPEHKIGTIGQFIYDLNCIIDSRKRNFDVILNLGYTSSSIWMKLIKQKTQVVTNMDGLEWKRTKYSKPVQRFLLYAERLAVKRSNRLIADSIGIKNYLESKYKVDSIYIAYGARLFSNANEDVIRTYNTQHYDYNMLIARMEPENNIEMILDGIQASSSTRNFFVVGNVKNKFGQYLVAKFKSDARIVFMGPIYEEAVINNLRFYSNLYFHGHSVGGTNPSLLEAMGCQCLIAAHRNEFNSYILEDDGIYFSSSADVTRIVDSVDKQTPQNRKRVENNFEKIKVNFHWDKIVQQYEKALSIN
jgi:glycosyltransferase involved in cell wall biosynthesis